MTLSDWRIVMSQEQKIAWLFLAMFLLAFLAVGILIPIVGIGKAWPALGIYGLAGFGPAIFSKKPKADAVAADERDKTIARKATFGAAMLSLQVFLLGALIPFYFYRHQGKELISIRLLPWIVFAGMTTFWLTRAVVILILYGREPKDVQD